MKKLFLFVGVVAAMISCAKNEISDLNETNPDIISIGTYVGQTTKGTIFDQDAVQESGFGLMAYYTGQTAWADSEVDGAGSPFTPDFMYNQKVEYSGTAWSYSPLKYWPNEENDKVTFFAYAPYETVANKVTASYTATDATGRPEIHFTLQDKAIDMIDFVAGQNMDMVRQQDKVTFNLKHQLTRATFSAITNVDNVNWGASATGDGDSYIVVKSMEVVNGTNNQLFTKGIYTFAIETTDNDKTNHDQDGTWEVSEPAAYSFASIMGDAATTFVKNADLVAAGYTTSGVVLPIATAKTDYTSLFMEDQYLFLLPPNGAEGLSDEDGNIQIEIVYDIVTVDDQLGADHIATESTYVITLPAATLAQGKAYNYQLQFDVTEILVEAVVIDWDEATTSTTPDDYVDPFADYGDNGDDSGDSGDETITTEDDVTVTVTVTDEEGDESVLEETEDGDYNYVLDILVGGESTITVTSEVTTTRASEAVVTWESSDKTIATVDSDGTVTGVGRGVVTITGTTETGTIITITVTVYAPITYIQPFVTEVTLTEIGATYSVTYTVYPTGDYVETCANIAYGIEESEVEVATFVAGTLTAISEGEAIAYINAKGSMSGNMVSCEIAVSVEIPVVEEEEEEEEEDTYSSPYNYNSLSIGEYVDADGNVSDSATNAVAVIYHVESDFALAVSIQGYQSVSNWCPTNYVSTKIGATSATDGWSNTNTMYDTFGTSTASSNPASYAKNLSVKTIEKAYDGNGKGEFYIPSLNEAYILVAAFFTNGGTQTLANPTLTSISGYSMSSFYSTVKSKLNAGSMPMVITSTEYNATVCRSVSSDASCSYGRQKSGLKLYNFSSSSVGSTSYTAYAYPIIKL